MKENDVFKEKRLSDWARENNMSYMKAYRLFGKNKIPNAYKDEFGGIFVRNDAPVSPLKKVQAAIVSPEYDGPICFSIEHEEQSERSAMKNIKEIAKQIINDDIGNQIAKNKVEISASYNPTTSSGYRRNGIATIQEIDRFPNIENGLFPHSHGSSVSNTSNIGFKDAIELCKKAYFNVAIFRNVIDLMTEFTVSDIFFEGGSQKSRDFFDSFFKLINLRSFQDKFFREYYRSGNVFIFKFGASFSVDRLADFKDTFGIRVNKNSNLLEIPTKYIILDPCEIESDGNTNFFSGPWRKVLTPYELERLKRGADKSDQDVLKMFPQETRNMIKNAKSVISVDLPTERIIAIFYKKQDYEPIAVPLGFPVLDDIEWKLEMKKIDKNISRKMDQSILLITMGTEPDKGGINYSHLRSMFELLRNPSISRTIVADYTTKAEFIIPDISNILDPKKYKQVNEDIKEGLNNILTGGDEKFSNQQIKTKIFMQRLEEGRQVFLNEFLVPEIEKISKALGLKSIPTPKFSKSDPEDDTELLRVYTRLMELGVLTPLEGLDAIKDGKIPTKESSLEAQKEFKKNKDAGLYEPLVGGSAKNEDGKPSPSSPGSPSGKQGAKSVKSKPRALKADLEEQVEIIGDESEVEAKEEFSMSNIVNVSKAYGVLEYELTQKLKSKSNSKKVSKKIKDNATSIAKIIAMNEDVKNWSKCQDSYIEAPIDKNQEMVNEILDVSSKFQVEEMQAILLYHSNKI